GCPAGVDERSVGGAGATGVGETDHPLAEYVPWYRVRPGHGTNSAARHELDGGRGCSHTAATAHLRTAGTTKGPGGDPPGPFVASAVRDGRCGSAGSADGLLEGRAGRDLHAVASGDLDLLARARVAAGAGLALDALDREQAGHLDGLALAEVLHQDVLEGRQSLVGVGLGQAGLVGDRGHEVSAVDGHVVPSSLASDRAPNGVRRSRHYGRRATIPRSHAVFSACFRQLALSDATSVTHVTRVTRWPVPRRGGSAVVPSPRAGAGTPRARARGRAWPAGTPAGAAAPTTPASRGCRCRRSSGGRASRPDWWPRRAASRRP